MPAFVLYLRVYANKMAPYAIVSNFSDYYWFDFVGVGRTFFRCFEFFYDNYFFNSLFM